MGMTLEEFEKYIEETPNYQDAWNNAINGTEDYLANIQDHPEFLNAFNLSESEKKVIRVSLNGDDKQKESLFTEMIRETIDILNIKLETSNVELKDKLLKTKDKLLRTEYKSETFTKDITKIFSLKDDLTK